MHVPTVDVVLLERERAGQSHLQAGEELSPSGRVPVVREVRRAAHDPAGDALDPRGHDVLRQRPQLTGTRGRVPVAEDPQVPRDDAVMHGPGGRVGLDASGRADPIEEGHRQQELLVRGRDPQRVAPPAEEPGNLPSRRRGLN